MKSIFALFAVVVSVAASNMSFAADPYSTHQFACLSQKMIATNSTGLRPTDLLISFSPDWKSVWVWQQDSIGERGVWQVQGSVEANQEVTFSGPSISTVVEGQLQKQDQNLVLEPRLYSVSSSQISRLSILEDGRGEVNYLGNEYQCQPSP